MLNVVDFLKNIPKTNAYGENITVVGATKMVDTATIKQAVSLGLTDIGENKVQEFIEKYDDYPTANYHFIGHLQTNKVKYLVGKVHLIQSVDSIKLLNAINEQAKKHSIVQRILLEVNIANDPNKHGFSHEEVIDAVLKATSLENIQLEGLMTVLPKYENKNNLVSICLQMRALYDIINKDIFRLKYLSMGMSNDFDVAIECGSNMIRIGSAIFGERNYDKL